MTSRVTYREKPLALVVDDDALLRLSMCAAMTKAGFESIEAESGPQAIELFQRIKPDLILLDVIMPEMDGFEACAAIRRLRGGKYVQILMVTGLDDTLSIERAFEAGANDFVSKPINWTKLGHRGKYMTRAGRAFQELNRSRLRLAKTQELAKLGNWELDPDGNIFRCSAEALRLLGINEGDREIPFRDFFQSVVAQERDTVIEHIESAIKSSKPFSVNYRVILADKTRRHILNRGELFYNENGDVEEVLGAVQDVTQLKNAEEEIRLRAFFDGLTGLANRMLFMERLDREILTSKRHKRSFALLFLDLDQFKRVNDTFGHHVGDLLLKNVSGTLKKCTRSSDSATGPVTDDSEMLIARLGGDEFILLLSDIREPENAAIVARRIIHEIPILHDLEGHRVSITTSIGISIYPADGEDAEMLMKHADSAMYHAKESGRNNYQFFKESLNIATLERFSLEQDIKHAVQNKEFVLYYQPQVDLSSREIVGAEALIRWMHPQKGMILPDDFLHLAEESGLIIEINKWVVQTACQQNEKWRKAFPAPVKIAVNLSGYRFANQNIVEIISDALSDADMDVANLEVEITENTLMQNDKKTIGVLKQMKELKLRIALDDFGTGYSSLSYLTSFPVDIIKIDRSFVMGSMMSENNRIIIKAIVAMGHSLGMTVVAEGIESEEQFELLKGYGVDEAQGFYFSPPVAEDTFLKFLQSGKL